MVYLSYFSKATTHNIPTAVKIIIRKTCRKFFFFQSFNFDKNPYWNLNYNIVVFTLRDKCCTFQINVFYFILWSSLFIFTKVEFLNKTCLLS